LAFGIPGVALGDESVTLFQRRSRRSNLLSKMNLKLTDITVSQTILESASRGEQTELTLRHSGVPDVEMGRQHKEGWTWVLSTLAERFARLSPSS
jgi:hypothetical protein